jgi:hypothetical protein
MSSKKIISFLLSSLQYLRVVRIIVSILQDIDKSKDVGFRSEIKTSPHVEGWAVNSHCISRVQSMHCFRCRNSNKKDGEAKENEVYKKQIKNKN